MAAPTWDDTAMGVLKEYEKRVHCKWFKIAVVFYRGDEFLTAGYNGPSRGEPHCDEVGCLKEVNGIRLPAGSGLCRGAHAEMNALANAAENNKDLHGARLYCSFSPCYTCAKTLANLSITDYVYRERYPDEDNRGIELLLRRGIFVRQFVW